MSIPDPRQRALEIRSISSAEVDLDRWHPAAARDEFVLIDVEIGAPGERGSVLFYVTAATQRALVLRGEHSSSPRRGVLIVADPTANAVRDAITSVVDRCDDGDWLSSVGALDRHFEYEYSNYVEET